MRRIPGIFIIVFLWNSSFAQDWNAVKSALVTEDFYRARFHLREMNGSVSGSLNRFRFNCFKLESFLLDRNAPADSARKLVEQNQGIQKSARPAIPIPDRQYFSFLEAWNLQAQHPDDSYKALIGQKVTDDFLQAGINYKKADLERNVFRNFNSAKENLKEAIKLYNRDSARYYFKIYKSRLLLGLVYRDESNNTLAEIHYRLGLAILDKIPEPKYDERAKVLNNLGNLFRSDYSKAKSLYEESLSIRVKYVKDSVALATAYTNLGIFYYLFGNYPQAREYYAQSLGFTKSNPVAFNQLVFNFSILLNEFYEISQSQQLIKSALVRSSSISPAHVSVIRLRLRLAQDELSLGNYNEAQHQLELVLGALRQFPANDPLRIDYYDLRSLQAYHKKDFAGMKANCDTAFQYFDRLKNKDNAVQINLLRRKADALMQLEKWNEAGESFRQLGTVMLKTQPQTSPAYVFNTISLGEVQYRKENYDSAIILFHRALGLSSPKGKRDSLFYETERLMAHAFLARSYFNLYKSKKDENSLRLAQHHSRQSIHVITSTKQKMNAEQDKRTFGKNMYGVFPLANDIAYQQYLLSPTPARAGDFFEITELSKSQLLIQSIREQKINDFAGVTKGILDYETRLQQKEEEVNRTMDALFSKENPEPEIVQGLQGTLSQLQVKKSHFIDSLQQHLPDYYNLKYNQTRVNIGQLQQYLSRVPNTALLAYGVGQENLYGILITADAVVIKPLGPLVEINRNVKLFRNQVKILSDSSLWTTTKTLYNQVFQAFEPELNKRKSISRLTIIPEDALVNLPFEALGTRSGKGKPHYLLEQFEISYGYSGTLFWQKNTDRDPSFASAGSFLGFAPSFTARATTTEETVRDEGESINYEQFSFAELPGARKEIESIQSAFDKKKIPTRVFIGDQATEQVFKKMSDGSQKFIHLATHGFTNNSAAWQSGIAFHRENNSMDDGLLLTQEIYGLRLNSELVILSACETGLGQYLNGEGVIGLTRAFLYAGARSIMVSLWKVEDASTATLMTQFYQQGILNKKTKSRSLRDAKLSLLKNGVHPFYWSSFILIGAE